MFSQANRSAHATDSKVIDVENDSLPEAMTKKQQNTSISSKTLDKFRQLVERRIHTPSLREEVSEAARILDDYKDPTVKRALNDILHPLRVTVGEQAATPFDTTVNNGVLDRNKFAQFIASPAGERYQKEINFGLSTLQGWERKWASGKTLLPETATSRANAIKNLGNGLLGKPRYNDDVTLRAFVEEGQTNFFKNLSALYDRELPADVVHPLIDGSLSELNVCDPGMLNTLQSNADYIDQLRSGKNVFDQFVKQRELLLASMTAKFVKGQYDKKIITLPSSSYALTETHLVAAHRWYVANKLRERLGRSPSVKAFTDITDIYASNAIKNKYPWEATVSFKTSGDELTEILKVKLADNFRSWVMTEVNATCAAIREMIGNVAKKNHLALKQQNIPDEFVFEVYGEYESIMDQLKEKGWGGKGLPRMNDIFIPKENFYHYNPYFEDVVIASLLQQFLDKKIIDFKKTEGIFTFDLGKIPIPLFNNNGTIDVIRPEHLMKYSPDNYRPGPFRQNLIVSAQRRRALDNRKHDDLRWSSK